MRKKSILLLLILFSLFSCKSGDTGADWLNDLLFGRQGIIFEVEFQNQAWGAQHYGRYIDNQGDIYEYDLGGSSWQPADYTYLPEEELLQKFANKQKIGSIDMDLLYQKFKEIEFLSNADLTVPQDLGCRDFGVVIYSAYKFNTQSLVYERIVLLVCGDSFQMNASTGAQTLSQWLIGRIKIMLAYGESCCVPTG